MDPSTGEVLNVGHSRRPVARLGLLLVPSVLVPGIAVAASCSGGGGHTDFHPPALVEFTARDVPVGAGLTPWLPANGGASTGEFRCDSNAPIDYRMETHGGFIRERYHESGAEYVVYETGVAGIGMAFLAEYEGSSRGRPSAMGYDEVVLHAGDSGTGPVGARLKVKYIRTGNIANGSATSNREMVIESRLYEGGVGPLRQQLWIAATTLKVQDRPSCRVRTQEVNMGFVPVAAFTGVGSIAGERSYQLVLDCEAGVGRVDYQVVPTTAVLDASQGIAEASGGVVGVGYQFLNGDGSPMRFYGSDEFGRGSANTEILRKTFGVRYRQTLPAITPGPANAGLTFSLTFP